jgi:Ser/Thr protein kinase RdoA (MazF antagonist)
MNTLTYTFIENCYDIGTITKLEEVRIGVFSENHFITTTKGKFFLKKNRDEVAHEIEKIEFAEVFFAKGSFPILLPLLTIDGNKHVRENGGCFTLYPFIDEEIISEKDLSADHVFSLGKLLGGMHVFSTNNKDAYSDEVACKDEWNKDKSFCKLEEIKGKVLAMSDSEEKTRYLKMINIKLSYIEKEQCSYDSLNILDYGLIHGDFHYGNIFFNKNAEVVSLFDFEKQKVASFAGELGRSIMLICFNNTYEEKNFNRVKHFLRGYTSMRKVSSDDLIKGLIIYITKLFFSYWFENEKINKGNNRLDALYADTSKSIIYFESNRDVFISRLLSMLA